MWKGNYKKLVVLIFALNSLLRLSAQNEISSPYSMYGIGILTNTTSGAYDAMGKVGYALQDPYLINFKNPASYVAFDSLSFIADAAFSIYSSTLSTKEITQKATYATPNYLTLGLPVTRHWRTSAGVMPFSNLGYSIIDQAKNSEIGQIDYAYEGKGGTWQLYWGNAFQLYKGLSIGLNISYLFGNLNYSKSAAFDGENFFHSRINRVLDLDGVQLAAGLQYFFTHNTKHKFGFGVCYENTPYVRAKQTDFVHTFSGASTNISDTVRLETSVGRLQMPQTIGGGFSYQFEDKVWLSADVSWQNWSKFSITTLSEQAAMHDALSYSFGIQFIPDATATTYIKRVRLRAGVRYCSGYMEATTAEATTHISDFSVAIGVGFPLKLYSSNSSVGILFEYGSMGTQQNNLLKDNYFRFSLHFTLQEKWYQRVKLD